MIGKRWNWKYAVASSWRTGLRSLGLSLMLAALIAATVGSGWAKEPASNLSLESGTPRAALPCRVMPEKPDLGFDLRFHAVYQVSVPVKVLAGASSPLQGASVVT